MTLVKRVTVVLGAVLPLSNTWAQSPAAVAPGNYECWGNGSARMLLNFKVTGKDRYTDPDVKVRGSFITQAPVPLRSKEAISTA